MPRSWHPGPMSWPDQAQAWPRWRRSLRRSSPACAASPGISPSDHAVLAPPELSLLPLVVVLELVQDDMSDSVPGLDYQVLVRRADSVGPAVRHLQPLAKVRQLLGQVRVLEQRGALHRVHTPVRGDQFMYRLASVEHPCRGSLDFHRRVG